jgi:hypothetical protein
MQVSVTTPTILSVTFGTDYDRRGARSRRTAAIAGLVRGRRNEARCLASLGHVGTIGHKYGSTNE